MSKVDIILPTYNCEKFITETLNSISKQSFKNWKLKIIDDASSDSTLILIKKFLKDRRINLKRLKRNKGAGFCRNLALKNSKAKYVAFIDADDIWKRNKLKYQVREMDKKNLDFTYTNFTPFTELNGFKKYKNDVILPTEFDYDLFVKKTSICTSSMIIKRKKIGITKFLKTKICEDYFFKCKLLEKVGRAINVDKNLTLYRISKGSLQSSRTRNLYWVWHINRKYNKMNLFQNLKSVFFISINSLKNYGFK